MKRALIVIDIQKGLISKLSDKLPSRIQSYIEEHGKDYALIIYTQFKNRRGSSFVKYLHWDEFMGEGQTAIVDELRSFVNRKNLFVKYTYGSFVDGKVLNALKKHKISGVDIVGIDTENCVLTFARDAFDRGFSVRVLKNMCASHIDAKLHRAALEIIKENIGEVVS